MSCLRPTFRARGHAVETKVETVTKSLCSETDRDGNFDLHIEVKNSDLETSVRTFRLETQTKGLVLRLSPNFWPGDWVQTFGFETGPRRLALTSKPGFWSPVPVWPREYNICASLNLTTARWWSHEERKRERSSDDAACVFRV